MGEYGALEQCLREGFIDYTVEADQRYVPKILTNNKDKKRKVLDTILSQLYVCDSFLFSVAFLTKSGIACLKDALIQNQMATGKILASQYLNFTEPGALRELLKFPNVELRMVTEERAFHAKGYLFHRSQAGPENYTMVIGSSNMCSLRRQKTARSSGRQRKNLMPCGIRRKSSMKRGFRLMSLCTRTINRNGSPCMFLFIKSSRTPCKKRL